MKSRDPKVKPTTLPVNFTGIPATLKEIPRWVCWRYIWRSGWWNKVPLQANGKAAASNDAATWAGYDEAADALLEGGFDGIGLVLPEGMAGIDLDDVFGRDEDGQETFEPWAQEVVNQFPDCHMERSPSGDGLHILCRGVARRSGKGGPDSRCEVHAGSDRGSRCFTVTGHRLIEGDVEAAQDALDWLHEKYLAERGRPTAAAARHRREVGMVSGFGQHHTNEPDPAKPHKVLTPYSTIDWPGVLAMVDKPQQVAKDDAQWLIPSTLLSRTFARQEAEGEFWMLWADFDTEPRGTAAVEAALAMHCIGSAQVEVYSSRSATAEVPKCRALVPLGKPLAGADWVLAQEVLNDLLQGAKLIPDRVSERTGQLCYLPNRGEFYEVSSRRTGKLFDPLTEWAPKLAAKRQALADKGAALEAARKAAEARREARAAHPGGTGGRSLIDAFNHAYDVSDILLQAGYAQRGDTFRHPASESGSYSASVKDGRVHSLSSSDPLYTEGGGIGAHDAFSAFEVLMHGGTQNAALKDAGDRWLTIGGESWNTVTRREWVERQAQESQPLPGSDEDGLVNDMPPLFAVVPFADLAHTQPAPPSYWWDGYLPAGVVTLLGAHGGTGKSMVALMLAVSIAQGLPLFGIATRRGKVAFFSGEDSAELVRYRLRWICEKLGIDVASLQGRLHILDASGGEPTLFHEVSHKGNRQGLTTPSYAALREFIDANGIDVLIIDNASDAYDASEIDRARVRGFMRALFRIAQARAGAVMLLAHVDKGTSRGERTGTESYSGSTAWHNSARSRLYLSRDKESGGLLLEHQKNNLGRMAEPLRLFWTEGELPQVEQAFGPVVQGIADNTDTKALLKLIHEFTARGEFVSTATTSRTHAGKLLRVEPGFPGRLKKDGEVFDLLRQADRRGWLAKDTHRGANRHEREVWKVTAAGIEAAGIKPTAPTAPTAPTSEVSAPDAAEGGCADCADFSARGCGGELRAQEAGAMADEEAT